MTTANRYRSKGSIGLIVPPRCNETVLEEAFRLRPPGLTWCFASLGMSEHADRDFEIALRNTEAAARELALRKVSVIVQAGLPLQVTRGPRYFMELKARLQGAVGAGLPVETDAGVVMMALHALGAKRVSLITPYQARIVSGLEGMIAADGFEIVSTKGEELTLDQLISVLDFDSAYDKAMESFRERPETDAFYLSCPQWPVVGNVERIEAETGRPVVTQLTAIMWWALTTLGLEDQVSGYGTLLGKMPPIPPL